MLLSHVQFVRQVENNPGAAQVAIGVVAVTAEGPDKVLTLQVERQNKLLGRAVVGDCLCLF